MDASPRPPAAVGIDPRTTDGVRVVDADREVQQLLDALDDPDCRRILAVTADGPRAAREVAERCEVSLSTAYRKLEQLVDARLLEEQTRLLPGGNHVTEYERLAHEVAIVLGGTEGLTCRVSVGPGATGGAPDEGRSPVGRG